MAKHVWTILCGKAIIDQESFVVAFDLVERITIFEKGERDDTAGQLMPSFIDMHMDLLGWWVRSDWSVPESVTFRVRLRLPSGEYTGVKAASTGEDVFVISLRESTGIRTKIHVPGIPWAGLGVYWFEVEEQTGSGGWQAVAAIPIELYLDPGAKDPKRFQGGRDSG